MATKIALCLQTGTILYATVDRATDIAAYEGRLFVRNAASFRTPTHELVQRYSQADVTIVQEEQITKP